MGFNRYIVECKYIDEYINKLELYGFNRYIVECKFNPAISVSAPDFDLIDT